LHNQASVSLSSSFKMRMRWFMVDPCINIHL
jgi:hypothetical protein